MEIEPKQDDEIDKVVVNVIEKNEISLMMIKFEKLIENKNEKAT